MSANASANHVTTLLRDVGNDRDARDHLFRVIEQRFRKMAGRLMAHERPGHSLQETILVDDAFGHLISDSNQWVNRQQFFFAAAKVMRRMLVDYARKRNAEKRGGGELPARLDGQLIAARVSTDPQQIVELNDLVERLEDKHPESFKVFNLHYFMGWQLKEIAEDILDMPYSTVKRRWSAAKAFLHRELFDEEPADSGKT